MCLGNNIIKDIGSETRQKGIAVDGLTLASLKLNFDENVFKLIALLSNIKTD